MFMFASGAFTPCLLSLRLETDRGRSFAQEKALSAVGLVTVGGEFLQNRTDALSSASVIRRAGCRRVLMGDNCGEQKRRGKEIKAT